MCRRKHHAPAGRGVLGGGRRGLETGNFDVRDRPLALYKTDTESIRYRELSGVSRSDPPYFHQKFCLGPQRLGARFPHSGNDAGSASFSEKQSLSQRPPADGRLVDRCKRVRKDNIAARAKGNRKFRRRFLRLSFKRRDSRFPLVPVQKSRSEPTRIEIDFDAAWFSPAPEHPSLHRYTLEIRDDEASGDRSSRVEYEAVHTFPKGRRRRAFERRNGKPAYVSKQLRLRPGDEHLASIPSNASLISTLARLGVAPFVAVAQDIRTMQSNIVESEPWGLPDDLAMRRYRDCPELVRKVSDLLPRLGLGIKATSVYRTPSGPTLGFYHHGLEEPVISPFESSGARHLVRIFPIVDSALKTGSLAVLDDFSVGFHADLATEIMRWFQSADRNPHGAQLICSSRNFSHLDDLEKEEVYVTEKDHTGATHAYGIRRSLVCAGSRICSGYIGAALWVDFRPSADRNNWSPDRSKAQTHLRRSRRRKRAIIRRMAATSLRYQNHRFDLDGLIARRNNFAESASRDAAVPEATQTHRATTAIMQIEITHDLFPSGWHRRFSGIVFYDV